MFCKLASRFHQDDEKLVGLVDWMAVTAQLFDVRALFHCSRAIRLASGRRLVQNSVPWRLVEHLAPAGQSKEDRLTLEGVRVFVVEDEALLLLTTEDYLVDLGCDLVDHAQRLEDALEKARELDVDIAILDVNLGGQRIDQVAEVLASRGIPFMFVTGYGKASLPPGLQDRVVLAKPYDVASLRAGLLSTLGRGGPVAGAPLA